MDKLKELLALVENDDALPSAGYFLQALSGMGEAFRAIEAYNGSLDAAKALHEALVADPYQIWKVTPNAAWFYHHAGGKIVGDSPGNPARAWLIAILKAKIAEGE